MANKDLPRFHKYFVINLVIFLVTVTTKSHAYLDNLNKPCKFLDSINITGGSLDETNESITYDGIVYSKHNYAEYDYEFVNKSYRQPVDPHLHDCSCNLIPCVRMCCPRGQIANKTQCYKNDSVVDLSVRVYDNEERFSDKNVYDIFNYVIGRPCLAMVHLEPLTFPDDEWMLFRNGNVLMGGVEMLDKNDYCLNPIHVNDSIELEVMICFIPYSNTKDTVLSYGMFISVPFLVVTILIYTILPELRNVHGKALVCYLLGLIVGYTTLGFIKLNGSEYMQPVLCRTLGYIVYFSFISAFFWLSVISFDLWWSFRNMHGISRFADFKKFMVYSTYAWGSTIFMVGLCCLMDASNVSTDFRPGMGENTCFLQKNRSSEFFYFYLPIIVIMSFNFTFFILTALKIRKVQMEMSRVTAKEDSKRHQKHLDNEKAKFGLFFRLFIVMGVTWTMEAISWIIEPDAWYFYVTDLTNTIQGVVIFLLFVMKPRVKELIIKRLHPIHKSTTKSSLADTRVAVIASKST